MLKLLQDTRDYALFFTEGREWNEFRSYIEASKENLSRDLYVKRTEMMPIGHTEWTLIWVRANDFEYVYNEEINAIIL
jgi:hypothetical protein